MAKRRNLGGRPAKQNATVTPMRLSKENREIAKTIGDGNMTAGVERALSLALLLSKEDCNLIRAVLIKELNQIEKEKTASILLGTRKFYTSYLDSYHESLAKLDEKLKTIESVLEPNQDENNATTTP